jgi:murein DD-endopeptidase MepM/ murein hydrolase activator NlpD
VSIAVTPSRDRAGQCAGCGASVPLTARPRIFSDGRIELTCEPCASGLRPAVVAVELVDEPPPARPRRVLRHAMLGIGAVAIGVAALALANGGASHSAAAASARPAGWDQVTAPDDWEVADEAAAWAPEDESKAPAPASHPALPPMPEVNGEPIDEWYPSLKEWTHPVPGSPDIVPTKGSRIFGAVRGGTRNECGGGHCGVDLEGERGQPVVAVAWGTVVKIQREDGGRGGRYVRIEHPDYVYTSYFHLDRIAPGLEIGQEIEPGTPIGTLGRSGIHISMPHLHFALEVPDEAGVNGLRHADPVPFLARAHVLGRRAVPELASEAPVDADADAGP